MKDSVLAVDLGIDATNDDLVDQMKVMRRAREERRYEHVVCCVRGFDNDPRELWDIPEVRAFCRRLVDQAFISYLDVFTTYPPTLPELVRAGFGAAEVWLIAEGLMGPTVDFSADLLRRLRAVINESNAKADALLGPMQEKK